MGKTIMTDLNAWAAEAKRHGMHYGDYVAAVEHGILPPPKRRPKPEPTVAVKTRKCRCCGEVFELTFQANGKYSVAKLCETCRETARRRIYGED